MLTLKNCTPKGCLKTQIQNSCKQNYKEPNPMPSTKNYRQLHKQIIARPGAVERLAELRKETLAEIELHEIRGILKLSQADLADTMGVTQSAVSQFERGDDILVSTLDNYVQGLGASLQINAIFEGDEGKTIIPIQIIPKNS